jgi:glycosyltransferase involved in cell wall biosynthesis
LKILHVIVGLSDVLGGPPRALATLARAQAARGDDVVVLPCSLFKGSPTLPHGTQPGLSVLHEPTRGEVKWFSPALRQAVRAAVRDRDIVHIHGTWRYHLLAAAKAARDLGLPYVVRPAGNLGDVCFRHKSYLKVPYFELIERRVFNRSAAVHCTSRKEQDELLPLRLLARTFVVPQPVESALADETPDHAELLRLCPRVADASRRIITYVGRISFVKCVPVLLDAFIRLHREFDDWDLVLAGPHEDAEIAARLTRRIAEAGVGQRVCMPGMVRGAAKAALLRRASIFAQPSSHENFGISVAEALLIGLPCVVSSGVALAADITEADAGVVCESEVPAFQAALHALLADEPRRTRCGQAAAKLARNYRPDVVADRLHAQYEVCRESPP